MVTVASLPPPRTTIWWVPGVVVVGMVTTTRKLPAESLVVVPRRTGSLKRSTSSGVFGGNPDPDTVNC